VAEERQKPPKHPGKESRPDKIDVEPLAAVLDAVNGMFCAYDLDGQIVYVNQKFRSLVGYADEVLKGMHISDLAIDRHKKTHPGKDESKAGHRRGE